MSEIINEAVREALAEDAEVTDRLELDGQIYKNFASTGCITEKEARAESAGDLQNLLREDHRYVFSLIQKFRVEKGATYPMLSDRSDVIVMTDEAHRSQYDVFALNMRNALPNAAFIGFTGTPLMAGEEKTREVFGDYVSVYNFRQAIEDNATVPLYYENRIPELQLINDNLDEDLQQILEAAELDPEQEEKLQREFAKDYHLITRDDRLEKVAADIVEHFMGRGFSGKAMVVSIDKVTAVRMYDKVQRYWKQYKQRLVDEKHTAAPVRAEELRHQIEYMTNTEMAVVVSQSQNEQQAFEKLGLDILSHRKRLKDGVAVPGGGRVPVDVAFKDPEHPF
jgi:type I restriction enzyme R subunit